MTWKRRKNDNVVAWLKKKEKGQTGRKRAENRLRRGEKNGMVVVMPMVLSSVSKRRRKENENERRGGHEKTIL